TPHTSLAWTRAPSAPDLPNTVEPGARGRQTRPGRIASDDLGDLGAFAEDGTPVQHTSDADYLAGLAELSEVPERAVQAPEVPAQPSYAQQQDAYAYQQQQADPYGYPQQQYAQQDAYGYQQADPYAAYPQHGYDQQPAYDQSGQQGYPQQQTHALDPQANALDETSLFDTTMISAEQLRAYEQGR
ncbi:hypothetical protein ACFW9X_10075, partial [Streptomyces sp. NPDC059466]